MLFEVKPNLTKTRKESNFAEFVIEPLPNGFGMTLGHSLRRVLLTSLEGAAITSIKVEGAPHEFTTLKGVKEDLVDIVLNVKKIKIALEGKEEATMTLDKKGKGEVKASDIECPSGVKILNPDQYITSLSDKDTSLKIEFKVEKGKGYLSAEKQEIDELGVVAVDGIFTPVLDVDYKVSNTRVGENTNFDKLELEITTNGGLDPEEALTRASEILQDYYQFIANPAELEDLEIEEEVVKTTQVEVAIEELDLPMRVVNSLNTAGIHNVSELVEKTEKEISQVKNLGAKSIKQIKEKLEEMKLVFKEEN